MEMSVRMTYMFASHTLANDFSVLVDEHLGLSSLGVDSSLGKCEKICGCPQFGCHHYFS